VTDVEDETGLPARPVDPDWLALREPADARSRDGAADVIVSPLLDWFAGQPAHPDDHRLHVVDLGAGTGANLRWLAPRLASLGEAADLGSQRWTLVDHDPRLHAWGPAETVTVRADVSDLSQVVADAGGADLITAAALLDLLDTPQLTAVVETVVGLGIPALFTLSVTGTVVLDPGDPLDGPLASAFDAHQRREGRLGPDAGDEVARLFEEHGWVVVQAPTPWVLVPGEAALIDAWIEGRAEAAVEWDPDLAAPAATWIASRRAQLATGELRAVVGHLDVLALPPGPAGA
jgi:SAM-dependent methyltransferase